jgi:hypothetical protein
MGQFVEHDPRQCRLAALQHGAQQGIIEPTQGRIGGGASDVHIEALLAQRLRKALRLVLGKIPAVDDATHQRKTPQPGLEGEFRGGEDVPGHRIAPQIHIAAVAAVVRQRQLLAGEGPDALGHTQSGTQRGIAPRVGQDLRHGLAPGHDVQVSLHGLAVIVQRCAAARQQHRPQPKSDR